MAERFGPPPKDRDAGSGPTSGGRLPVVCPFKKGPRGEKLPCLGPDACDLFDALNAPDGSGPTRVTGSMWNQCGRARKPR